jgi:hypothetical protein
MCTRTHMKSLQHGHEIADGISCNDRKFEVWELEGIKADNGKLYNVRMKVQVYVVPKDGFRGASADGFKIVINGVPVVSRDIGELREKATALIRNLSEDEHEKVLVVKTSGSPNGGGRGQDGDTFGLEWQVGWRVAKLDVVFNEGRSFLLDVENYDEPDEPEVVDGIKIGAKRGYRGVQHNKTAVIPWTKEREELLKKTVKAIGGMRDDLNAALLKPEAFAGLLDAKAGVLLLTKGKS